MKFKEHIVFIDEIKLRYFSWWKWKNILFLHGWWIRTTTYKHSLNLLSKKYSVIAPDIPCFGKSSIPSTIWDFNDFANFFEKFLNILNLNNVAVVWHSFGWAIASVLSSKTNRINKLILIDSAGICPNYSKWHLTKLLVKKTLDGFLSNIPIESMVSADFVKWICQNIFHFKSIYKIVDNSMFKNYDTNIFENITKPTFILWGNKDSIFSLEIAEIINQSIEWSNLKILDGSHDWCLFQPYNFFDEINKIVD